MDLKIFKLKPSTLDLNGKSLEICLKVLISLDDMNDPSEMFENPEDIEALNSGRFELVTLEVQASLGPIEFSDLLGGVVVESGWMDSKSIGFQQILGTVKEHGMESEALSGLKLEIENFLKILDGGK